MIDIAIVGTGGMANAHANSYRKIRGAKVVACCDIRHEAAEAFAEKHGIAKKNVFADLDAMLAEAKFDAVSNVTSDGAHCATTLACLKAGKYMLCEKPLAVNYAEAKKMVDAAKKAGVINMVNFSYRNSSVIHRAASMVAKGQIGRVMHVEASYLQSWLVGRHWGDWRTGTNWLWRLSSKHGSKGVLGDLGVHILDFATYPAGKVKGIHCKLKTFSKAKGNRIGEYHLDANDSAVMTVEFAGGAIGTIHTTRWATGHINRLDLAIFGDKGAIRINLDKSYNQMKVCRGRDAHKNAWKTVKCSPTPNMYQRFIKSIKTGKNDQPDFARGAEIQKILDACFESDKKDKTIQV